jgi:hypothetical protein
MPNFLPFPLFLPNLSTFFLSCSFIHFSPAYAPLIPLSPLILTYHVSQTYVNPFPFCPFMSNLFPYVPNIFPLCLAFPLFPDLRQTYCLMPYYAHLLTFSPSPSLTPNFPLFFYLCSIFPYLFPVYKILGQFMNYEHEVLYSLSFLSD